MSLFLCNSPRSISCYFDRSKHSRLDVCQRLIVISLTLLRFPIIKTENGTYYM